MTNADRNKSLLGASGFAALVLLWSFVSYFGVFPAVILPTPWDTLAALGKLLSSPDTAQHIAISVGRIAFGFAVASIIGVTLGAAAGGFQVVRQVVMPLNSAFRYIPPTSFVGLTIIWFGIGEASKIALIAIAILFYVVHMVADAIQSVPQRFVDAARSLGANANEVFFRIILPASRHRILAALRVNLGAAWTFLIVAEIISAQSGLGYLMATSQRFLLTDQLFALLILVGILGVATGYASSDSDTPHRPMGTNSLLVVDRVSTKFGSVEVIRSLSLEIEAGSITVLLAPSGAGKTTLLRMICGFQQPTSGEVRVAGKKVDSSRHRIGMVFQ